MNCQHIFILFNKFINLFDFCLYMYCLTDEVKCGSELCSTVVSKMLADHATHVYVHVVFCIPSLV